MILDPLLKLRNDAVDVDMERPSTREEEASRRGETRSDVQLFPQHVRVDKGNLRCGLYRCLRRATHAQEASQQPFLSGLMDWRKCRIIRNLTDADGNIYVRLVSLGKKVNL